MSFAVGLTTSDLKSLLHNSITLSCSGPCDVFQVSGVSSVGNVGDLLLAAKKDFSHLVPAGKPIRINANSALAINTLKPITFKQNSVLFVLPKSKNSRITVSSLKRFGAKGRACPSYRGILAIYRLGNKLSLALICDIDDYLRGVLASEIPSSYHLEAIKAQAVAARTYSLNPRISHLKDKVNVCDSYLCCQYFGGLNSKNSKRHLLAIEQTSHEVVTYQNKPILALFSSNAGGHTESYENCFSDPRTGQFPPPKIPYLKGVPELKTGRLSDFSTESYLKKQWQGKASKTVDSWSHHFKWSVNITANQLEGHLHNNVSKLRRKKETAPFVVAPSSGKFGHIDDILIKRRGVSGTIVELAIKTNHGIWAVSKELVIRDLFVIPKAKIRRLKSARFFIAKSRGRNGHLTNLKLYGLGWGHGCGLQQTGAQGWAKAGLNYRQILSHYYTGTRLEKI